MLIVRDGRSFVPDDTTRLMRGDQALLVSARRSRPRGGAAAAGGQPRRPAGQLAGGGGRAHRGRLKRLLTSQARRALRGRDVGS